MPEPRVRLSAHAPKVRVNRKAADRVASGHPWIFASDIADRGDAAAGDVVHVYDPRDRVLGTFLYSSTSQITLRQLSPQLESISKEFLLSRLQKALTFRERTVRDSDSYRLVHGEADLLPSLVIDRYADSLTVQTLSQGIERLQPLIVTCLSELLQPRTIVARNDVAVRKHEALPLETRTLMGEVTGPVDIHMNGLLWSADLLHGQKTGVYLDQRENYLAAARYAHGQALDCFTSTGGFALHMAAHCQAVEGVDGSAQAISTAQQNADRNGIGNVRFREADVFDLLTAYAQSGKRFDTMVLDPPAFTKTRGAVEGAARGYKDINYRALRLLDRGGVLVTCSCSHHFSEAMLLETIAAAALDAGRTLRILERRTQSQDHPILLTVPETLYLKCLILEVV